MADLTLDTTATIPSGASITVEVKEDTDDDGTAENTDSTTIDDGSNTYTLSGYASSASDYWLTVTLSSGGDVTQTPSLDSVTATLDTEQLEGQVLDEGEVVEDAVVIIVNTEQIDYNDLGSLSVSDLAFEAVAVTDSNGDWSAEVSSIDELHAIAEWTDGTDEANALSKPFL